MENLYLWAALADILLVGALVGVTFVVCAIYEKTSRYYARGYGKTRKY